MVARTAAYRVKYKGRMSCHTVERATDIVGRMMPFRIVACMVWGVRCTIGGTPWQATHYAFHYRFLARYLKTGELSCKVQCEAGCWTGDCLPDAGISGG
jgi:hypothetical protein